MAYTEIKRRNEQSYYYRVISIREGQSVMKKRMYLGSNLTPQELSLKEKLADSKLKRNKELERITPLIRKVLIKNNVRKAGIFGSTARGERKKGSDIDILIEPPKGMGYGFVRLKRELEDALKEKVDVVTYKYIHPRLRDKILKEEVRIL